MTSAKPLRADAKRNYDRLIESAQRLFKEQGTDASLDEIARRADVGIGTLYRHFPSREHLVAAVLEEHLRHMHAMTLEMLSDPDADPRASLVLWSRHLLKHAVTYRATGSTLVAALDDGDHADWATTLHIVKQDGAQLLARAQAAGAVRDDIEIGDLARMLHGIAMSIDRAPDKMVCGSRLFDICIRGIQPDS
jgi:AcrR family transcriptional regulator